MLKVGNFRINPYTKQIASIVYINERGLFIRDLQEESDCYFLPAYRTDSPYTVDSLEDIHEESNKH